MILFRIFAVNFKYAVESASSIKDMLLRTLIYGSSAFPVGRVKCLDFHLFAYFKSWEH